MGGPASAQMSGGSRAARGDLPLRQRPRAGSTSPAPTHTLRIVGAHRKLLILAHHLPTAQVDGRDGLTLGSKLPARGRLRSKSSKCSPGNILKIKTLPAVKTVKTVKNIPTCPHGQNGQNGSHANTRAGQNWASAHHRLGARQENFGILDPHKWPF